MAPVAQSRLMKTAVPSVSGSPYSGDGSVRIRHREYIGDVSSSIAFANSQFSVNPGLAATFPWLSVIAANYESYLFTSLSFEYETQVSTATSGTLMLAIDFDAADAAPVSKVQLMSYHNAVRSPLWSECQYRGDVQDLHKFGMKRYVRTAALAANLDIKTYDVGTLNVATQGAIGATPAGELYVVYDITLNTPQLASVVPPVTLRTASMFNNATQTFAVTVPELVDVAAGVGFDPLAFGPQVLGVFTPPAGRYVIDYWGTGGAACVWDTKFLQNGAPLAGAASISHSTVGNADCTIALGFLVVIAAGDTFAVEATMVSSFAAAPTGDITNSILIVTSL